MKKKKFSEGLKIEDGVLFGIGDCEDTDIVIPDGVTSINDYAFYNCTGLTSIIIPDSVTSIGEEAFSGCTGLTSITIGNSVTSIGQQAFDHCTGLTSITIPNSIKTIGLSAFICCTSLSSITIPDSVTGIVSGAFNCTAWDNNQPNGVVYVGKVAYRYKEKTPRNTSIVLKEGTTGIARGAFIYFDSLTSITIPNSVTSIGDNAFCASGLTSVTYTGTKAQWKAVSKETDWNDCAPFTVVHCTDGDVSVK